MNGIIVVSDPDDWHLEIPDVRVVAARDYLTDPAFAEEPRLHVFNLCRSYRYQRTGYYVSLLAEARGHRPLPDIETIQDLKSRSLLSLASRELDEQIQSSLGSLESDRFELSVYFGRNLARRHDGLASSLFRMFRAPLLRAEFRRSGRTKRWAMHSLNPVAVRELPAEHRDFVREVAREFFSGRVPTPRRRAPPRFDLALLRDPADPEPASDERALRRFVRAGEAVGFAVEVIGREDHARIPEFDALFIRDTTSVNHYTYRFARTAKARGLVVVDDPEVILKCLNKVYLAELMQRHRIATPRTLIVNTVDCERIERELGLPCVLKQPDSAFSAGVVKVESRAELAAELERLLDRSALVVAQEFRPTSFDWRIGVLDGQPLYACRYHMARRHWQIIKRDGENGVRSEGGFDTLPVEQAPTAVVRAAVKAASLYGDALFGVDLKQDGDQVFLIEVNENPSIDAGVEDLVLKDELYLRIMRWFMGRVEQRKRARVYS